MIGKQLGKQKDGISENVINTRNFLCVQNRLPILIILTLYMYTVQSIYSLIIIIKNKLIKATSIKLFLQKPKLNRYTKN